MLKKFFFKINVWLDTLKGILIFFLVWALIIFFGAMVVHNILKMTEMSNTYKGEYKKLVEVDEDKMLNVKIYGEGERTIVVLPEFGSSSPVLYYKAIADKLSDEYKVAVVEYYGYGYSMFTDKERTLENISSEVRAALAKLDIFEFILMPDSMSNLYAMKMVQMYPSAIQGVIVLDGLYPAKYKESYFYEEYLDELHNTELTAIVELSGFARILSYIQPDYFYINKMKDAGIWGQEEVKVVRNRIATTYLTENMIQEINKLKDNATEFKDYKYPENIPVLHILVSETVEKYENLKNEGKIEKDLKDLASEVITDIENQEIVIIEGNHDIQFTNYEKVSELTKAFLNGERKLQILASENYEEVEPAENVDTENIIQNEVEENVLELNIENKTLNENKPTIYEPKETKNNIIENTVKKPVLNTTNKPANEINKSVSKENKNVVTINIDN